LEFSSVSNRVGGFIRGPAAFTGFTVGVSIPCIGCKYDLRGLQYEARCPECGKLASTTLDKVMDGYSHREVARQHAYGLRLATGSWMVYLCLPLTCLSSIFAALVLTAAPIWRLMALRELNRSKDAIQGQYHVPVPMLATCAVVTAFFTIALGITMFTGPNLLWMMLAMVFFISTACEGAAWMHWTSTQARALELPFVGTLARIVNIVWILVPIIGITQLVAAPLVVGTNLVGWFLLPLIGYGVFCGLLTAGVCNTFAEIIRQVGILQAQEEMEEPLLVEALPGSQVRASRPPVQEEPLEVAEATDEEIRFGKDGIAEISEDPPKPRTDGPGNPTGIY